MKCNGMTSFMEFMLSVLRREEGRKESGKAIEDSYWRRWQQEWRCSTSLLSDNCEKRLRSEPYRSHQLLLTKGRSPNLIKPCLTRICIALPLMFSNWARVFAQLPFTRPSAMCLSWQPGRAATLPPNHVPFHGHFTPHAT